MSPQRNPIKKALITKTTDGRLYVAVVGEISRPAVFKQPSFCLATIGEREPAPFKGESFESYLDRLYSPLSPEDAANLSLKDGR
jgi:hypothetical protein